ncbi:50S ribosomal protein L3 [Candidatus Azambacteria bacterium]|nr:50S ribosomal protein L3 [Candidatus Azambacteria bacterium]
MKFIIGKKLNMTQIFDEGGKVVPVTLVEVDPCTVTQIRTEEKDGYKAVQIGSGHKKNINKPEKGHLKDLGQFLFLKEFRTDAENYKVGDKIEISTFAVGDGVNVSGISKGKGFQGVVKRHHFSGGPGSHGQAHNLRSPGSIGAGGVQRVFKGRRMAGRTGSDRVFTKGLKVVKVDAENGILAISGALPGRKGTLVEIVSQK